MKIVKHLEKDIYYPAEEVHAGVAPYPIFVACPVSPKQTPKHIQVKSRSERCGSSNSLQLTILPAAAASSSVADWRLIFFLKLGSAYDTTRESLRRRG